MEKQHKQLNTQRMDARQKLAHARHQLKELEAASALRADDAARMGLERSIKDQEKRYSQAQLVLEDRPKNQLKVTKLPFQDWNLHCGVETWQCMKETQEDRYVNGMQYGDMVAYMVLDGHSGSACADYTSEHLWGNITKRLDTAIKPITEDALKQCVTDAFAETDEAFLNIAEKQDLLDGTTCCLVIFWIDENDVNMDGSKELRKKALCANVGDSRAVMSKLSGRGIRMSDDHKPNRPDEIVRINKAGGQVVDVGGVPRVFTNHAIEVNGMSMQVGFLNSFLNL